MQEDDTMTACRVVDDHTARTRYPYLARSHELLYPGKLVPLWAVETVGAFESAGFLRFGQRLARVLKRVRKDALRAELVRALGGLVRIRPEGPTGEELPRRALAMTLDFFEEHRIKGPTAELLIELEEAIVATRGLRR